MIEGLAGIFAPVVSTFDPTTGELSAAPFRANIEAHLAAGLSGVVVAGSTGEAALLDETERQALVEWARPLMPSTRWLIAGTGAESTRLCLARTHAAAARGADAALVMAPHYYVRAMSDAALRDHFWRVADESPIPLILYNNPRFAHFNLSPDLVDELSTHERIIGMKESSGDFSLLSRYLSAQSSTFSVLTGHAGILARAARAGIRGGILTVSLFVPALTAEVFEHGRGDDPRAGASQDALSPLAATIVAELGVPAVKAALDSIGLSGGPVRAPLQLLDPADRDRVATMVRSALPAGAR